MSVFTLVPAKEMEGEFLMCLQKNRSCTSPHLCKPVTTQVRFTFSPTAPGFPIPPEGPCGPSAPGGPEGPLGPGGPGGPYREETKQFNFKMHFYLHTACDQIFRILLIIIISPVSSYQLSNVSSFTFLTWRSRQTLRECAKNFIISLCVFLTDDIWPQLVFSIIVCTCSPTGPGGPGNPLDPSSPFWPNRPCWPLGPGSPSAPCATPQIKGSHTGEACKRRWANGCSKSGTEWCNLLLDRELRQVLEGQWDRVGPAEEMEKNQNPQQF